MFPHETYLLINIKSRNTSNIIKLVDGRVLPLWVQC